MNARQVDSDASLTPHASVLHTETTPGSTITSDALNTWIKINSGTEYHPLGTCAMLPKASGGVVDTNLLVYVRVGSTL